MLSSTRHCSAWLRLTALLVITFTPAFAATLQAQVVSDPRIAEFDPSPDHWTVLDNGRPAVLRYELGVYTVGAVAPFATVNMGKPSPNADGKIRYDFSASVAGWSLPGGDYEARVSAVGPEGAALSDPSNRFTFGTASPCTASLSATAASVPASSSSYAVRVSTGPDCGWTVSTALSWVTTRATGGSGSATVLLDIAANSSSSPRTGTITIGGQVLALSQAGVAAYQLTVIQPTGGIVQGAGIYCGTSATLCLVVMPSSMLLGLQAVADGGHTFSGWSGDCSGTGASYTLLLNGAKSCGASFNATTTTPSSGSSSGGSSSTTTDALTYGRPYRLTITRGSGGTVKSAGINCGTTGDLCAVEMPAAMTIGLQAESDSGYVFTGWSGNCSGTNASYWLALEGPRTCSAMFAAAK